MKDFFISYTSSDAKWAEWIAWQLEAAGYEVVVQLWDFHPGNDFIAEMERASREANQTLAVLSPRYFESRFTEAEWTAAFKKGNLLPVRVVDFDVEGLLSVRAYIDIASKSEDQAREVLLEGVKRERRKPSVAPGFPVDAAARSIKEQPQFPGALSPIWNVPQQRNPNFVGREALLDQIHETLTSKNAAALTAIHGMGGVGKTQLAAEYAYDHSGDYQVVWWIKSEEPAALASDYAALAEALELPQKQERDQRVIVAAGSEWLNHHGGWLLIFDNARRKEDLRGWLPQNRAGHVVITSRDPNWGGMAKPLEVEVLTREDAVRFLLQRTGQDDIEASRQLAEALGDLPLALEQAGAYIETTGKPISEYLALFKTRHGELLLRGKPDEYPDTVATTWEISFQAAQQESPAAAALLNVCAFLAPDDIPIAALRDGKDRLPDLLAETVADEVRFDEAIATLRRYSLIERSDDGLFVHRLVQMVVRDRLLDDERNVAAEAAVRVVNDSFPQESDDVRTWADCVRLCPHAMAVAEFSDELLLAPKATGRLLNQMGLYYQGRARYAEARQTYERALRIYESAFGENHAWVAAAVSNVGSVLRALGDLAQARKFFERSLRINEAALGPNNPTVAIDVNNLGGVLQALGDLTHARKCFERSLRIHEAALGSNHATVAIYVNNLGSVLQAQGNLASARECFERALRIDEATLGHDHPKVAIDINNLGTVLKALGDLEGARQCFERALRISEAALGLDHPDLAIPLSNLCAALRALGDLTDARQCAERALRIDEAAFDGDHPNRARELNNLGRVLEDLGDLAQARECYARALQMLRRFLDDDHPHTVLVRNNLESLKREME